MSTEQKDYFSATYDRLLTLDVHIDGHDVAPPSYINRKIAECGQKLGQVQKIFIKSNRSYTVIRRNLNIDKSELEILKRKALTSSEKIKKLPSIKEREAAVDDLYEDKHRAIAEAEEKINDYQNLLSALRAQIQLLRSKNSDLKTMARMTELNITKLNNLPIDHADIKDFANDLADIKEVTDEIDVEDFDETVESSAEEIDKTEDEDLDIDIDNIDTEDAEIGDDLLSDSAPEQKAGTNKPDGSVGNATEEDSIEADLDVDLSIDDSDSSSGDESSSDQNGEQVDGMDEVEEDSVDDILDEFGSDEDTDSNSEGESQDRDEAQQRVRMSNDSESDSEDMLDIDLDESDLDNSAEEGNDDPSSSEKAQEPVNEDEASVSTEGIDVDDLLDSL